MNYVLDLETSTDRLKASLLKRSELIFEEEITFTCAMMYAEISPVKPEIKEFYGKKNSETGILNLPPGRYYTWNGAKFDSHFIFHLLRKASYVKLDETKVRKQSKKKQLKKGEFTYLLVGSRLISLTFRNHLGIVEIRDACLLFTCSLNNFITNTAPEYPKLVDTYDYTKFRVDEEDFTESDKDYCRSDIYGFSVGLYRIIRDFEKAFGMDISDSFTAGSFAMKYAKLKLDEKHEKSVEENILFADTEKPFPSIDELFPSVNFDRKFVMGGRTYVNPDYEGIIFGDTPSRSLTKIDANSFYPAMMVNTKLPYGKQKKIKMKGVDLDEYLANNPQKYVFAHLLNGICKYNDMYSPIIINDGTIREYPTHAGSQDMVYLDDNTLRDPKFKHSNAIFECYIFDGVIGIMDYMSEVFDLKNLYKFEEKYGLELTVKIILNSTFGKFIQRDRMPEYDFFDGIIEPIGTFSSLDSWHLYPPFGAAITANARYELTKFMNLLQERFIYGDTDSLVFYGDVPPEIPLGFELGEWKIEASPTGVWNEKKQKIKDKTGLGVFFQRKTYALELDDETHITFCGISGKAIEKEFPEGTNVPELTERMKEGISFDVLQGNHTLNGVVLIERNRIKKFVPRL